MINDKCNKLCAGFVLSPHNYAHKYSIHSYLSDRMVASVVSVASASASASSMMSSSNTPTGATNTTTSEVHSSSSSSSVSSSSKSMKWEPVSPSMNTARDAMGVDTLAGVGLFAVGGGDNHGNYFKSIEVYSNNVAASTRTTGGGGTWTYGPDMNYARSSLGVGVINRTINNLLYAVGGRNHNGILDVMEMYDPRTKTWSIGPPMKETRRNMGVTTLGGKLIVLGGENNNFTILKSVEMYDPKKEIWTTSSSSSSSSSGSVTISSMNTARQSFGACSLDGKLYVVGGINSQGTHLNTMEIFDPTTNEWTAGPSMSTPHICIGNSVTTYQGRIYVVDTGSSVRPTTTTTTASSNESSSNNSSNRSPNSNSSSGGVEIFDPSTQEWSFGPALNGNPRLSLGSCVYENELYAVGGYDIDNEAPVNSVSVLS